MARFPDLHEPLAGDGVLLRYTEERDIPEILIAHDDDQQMARLRHLERPPSGAELGRAAEAAPVLRMRGEEAELTIVIPGSDVCCGQVTVHDVAWEHGRAVIGLWLAPAARGHGRAAAALRVVADWLFDDIGLIRLSLYTLPDNEPMLRTAAAAGFVREGVLRSVWQIGRERVDDVVFSLLPDDRG